ncbi:MAG: hypothetical protein ABW133_25875 [Polyangiaceae bacterium]
MTIRMIITIFIPAAPARSLDSRAPARSLDSRAPTRSLDSRAPARDFLRISLGIRPMGDGHFKGEKAIRAMGIERVTISLPVELVESIDTMESNRSRFVTIAVRNELVRRRRAQLLDSLDNPHPDAIELTILGLDDWDSGIPPVEEGVSLHNAGKRVRWAENRGWMAESE